MELLERLVGKLERAPQRLSGYAFSRIMRSGRQTLTRWRAQQVVRMLGERGKWQRAVDVVCWLASREGERLQASRHIFTTLIAILGRQQSPDAVLEAFYAMMESYETWPDMPAYRAAAKALGRAGYLRQLLQVMADLRKGPDHGQKRFQVRGWSGVLAPDVHIYNSVLNACVQQKQWRGVQWVLDSMQQDGATPNAATFGLAIEVMVRSGRADNAWAFWEHMNAAGLQPNSATYKSLVAAMGEAGRASVACELVVDMEQRGIDGSASVYYALACALCMAGRWREAVDLVGKIRNSSGAEPAVVTFTGLIRACERAGLLDDADAVFRHMEAARCAPNINTCNAMIRIYGRSRQMDKCRRVFASVRSGRASSQSVHGTAPRLAADRHTYNAMLAACVRCGAWEEAEGMYREMARQGVSPDASRHAWVVEEATAAGQENLVGMVLERMEELGQVAPSRWQSSGGGSEGSESEIERERGERNYVLRQLQRFCIAGRRPELSAWHYAVGYSADLALTPEQCDDVLTAMGELQCVPDLTLYGGLIRAVLRLAGAAAASKAVQLLDRLEGEGFVGDVAIYGALVRRAHAERMWELAVALCARAESSQIELAPQIAQLGASAAHAVAAGVGLYLHPKVDVVGRDEVGEEEEEEEEGPSGAKMGGGRWLDDVPSGESILLEWRQV